MTLALIIILSIMTYLTIGGAACSRIQLKGKENCTRHRCDGDCGHMWIAGFSTIAWPVTLPLVLGARIGAVDFDSRTNKRRTKEIAEANHKVQLAKIRAQETIEMEKAALR